MSYRVRDPNELDQLKADFNTAHGREPDFRELLELLRKKKALEKVTDRSLPFSERRYSYLEQQGRPRPVADPRFVNPDGSIIGLEDLHNEPASISDSAQRVNKACDSISIFDVYDRLIGKKREPEGGKTENVMAFCPEPSHDDQRSMSAWFGIRNRAWMLCCGHDNTGWDKFSLAGLAWGLDARTEFWEIKKRLAKEFCGVEYEKPRPPAPSAPVRVAQSAAIAPHPEEDDPYEQAVQKELGRQRIYTEARARLRREKDGETHTPFSLSKNLGEILAEPKRETEWTIEGLHGVGTNTTITGGPKSGKTTLIQNLLKSLADRVPLFGEREVRDISGNVAYLNLEVDDDEMRERLERLNISKVDRILPLNLRSHRFDLLNEQTFAQMVEQLNTYEVEILVIDPWARVNLSESENDNAAAIKYLQAIDTLKAETGVVDGFLAAHSMKNAELGSELTVRGASAVDGWADYRWMVFADAERRHYFKLGGSRRNDEHLSKLRESTLGPDGRLRLGAITQARASSNNLDAEILAYVAAHPGCVKTEIAKHIGGTKATILDAIRRLHQAFELVIEVRGKAHHCYLAGASPTGSI